MKENMYCTVLYKYVFLHLYRQFIYLYISIISIQAINQPRVCALFF